MKLSLSPLVRRALACSALLAGTGLASAQTNIAGNLSDDTTGPLLSGVVYHATSNLLVPGAKTLTIQPGAIVKFVNASQYFQVFGTLDAQGTAGQPVIVTDIRDDSAGGDTNGDGASSTPGAGFRGAFYLYNGSATTLAHTEVRYGGYSSVGQIEVAGSSLSLTMTNCVVRDGQGPGISLAAQQPTLAISDCSFERNSIAVDNVRLDSVPSFVNNVASANGGNYIRVTSAAPNVDAQIGPANTLGGALVIANNVLVGGGLTLELLPATVLKFQSASQYTQIYGNLDAQGTAGQPVVITDIRDDSVGGDTNNDGAGSAPGAAFRGALYLYNGSTTTLAHTELRFGGYGGNGQVELQGSSLNLTMTDCVVRDGGGPGINVALQQPTLAISGCSFERNTIAVDNARLDDVPSFVNNVASANAGNYIRVTSATPNVDTQIGPTNTLGGALVIANNVLIGGGLTLELLPATVLKFQSASQYTQIYGNLDAQGTSAQPVVITDIRDDSVGGDTNGDAGASAPGAAFRGALYLYNGSTTTLAHTELRFGGYGGNGQVELQGSSLNLTMTACIVRDGGGPAINVAQQQPTLAISGCSFERNGIAVDNARLDDVPSFVGNFATNNAGNYIRVVSAAPNVDTQIGPTNTLGGALVIATNLLVSGGITLDLLPSTVLKFQNASQYAQVYGRLVTSGGADHPPIVTSIQDDSAGGDTNGDGAASSPGAGFLGGMYFEQTSDVSAIDGLTLRYAGYGGGAAARLNCGTLQPRWLRVEHGVGGIEVYDVGGDVERWVAWDCSGVGVYAHSDSFDLRHVTIVGCATGFRRDNAFTGRILDSIAWGCSQATQNFGATNFRYADGDVGLAGQSGNIVADPLFFDGANGDFHLTLASPCIDSGDPLSPPDADSTRSDMGAYSFDFCTPRRYCVAKVTSNGCTPTIDWSGTSSITGPDNLRITASNVMSKKSGVLMWGLTANSQAFHGGTLCVASPMLRKPVLTSGGNLGQNDCSGAFDTLFDHAYMQAHGVGVGDVLHLQFWFRDSGFAAPDAVGLSDALTLMICP